MAYVCIFLKKLGAMKYFFNKKNFLREKKMKYDTKELDFHIIIPFVFNYLHFRNVPFVTFFCWILHLREPNIINNECYRTNQDFQNVDLGSQSTDLHSGLW